MGKPIVYCEICGQSISAESILLENAVQIQSAYYCKECATKLNIKGVNNRKTLKKLPKKKVNIEELPDISIPKMSTRETFFTRYKKELTYLLYTFSIFIIIFSALFIIYKYALSKPNIKDISAEKCKSISELIKKTSFDSKSAYITVLDAIQRDEDILKGSACESEVFKWKEQAQAKVTEIEKQEKFFSKLQEIENNPNIEEAIAELDFLYNSNLTDTSVWNNEVRARFQDTSELLISKLWEAKKKQIEVEYLNSPYSFEDYLNQIEGFVTKYVENNKYSSKYILPKKAERIREISSFKESLKYKFERAAEEYKSSLITRLSELVKDGKCEEAEKEALNFSTKYIGTNVYKTKDELLQNIKQNCKPQEKSQTGEESPSPPPENVIYPYPGEESSKPTETEETSTSKDELQNKEDKAPQENKKSENKKYVLFNGKDKKDWVEINKNAKWQVWQGSLYGYLPKEDKNSAIIYYSSRTFKNFYISFKYKIRSGSFFVCFRMSPKNPAEKLSFLYMYKYEESTDYAEFSAKVFNNEAIVKAPQGNDGTAAFNEEVNEGYIGFMILNGTEVYFKDIVVEERPETEEELKGSIVVPLFNGKDLKKWVKSGLQAKWEVVENENAIYGENTAQKKEGGDLMSVLSVLYFDDKNFQPNWTNYTVSFEFNIAEDGFLVFGKFPTEGNANGTLISTKKGLFSPNTWYKAEVTVTEEKIVVDFLNPNISPVEEKIDNTLKGYFGFGILPGQKVYLRNIKLRFIK